MKRFVYCSHDEIPEDYIEDCKTIQSVLMYQLDILISLKDVYKVWLKISKQFCAGWLKLNDEILTEEFLLEQLKTYGYLIDM